MEVAEEAASHGKVNSVAVHVVNGAVRVFIDFESPAGVAAGKAAMHGRMFDGRTVTAQLYDRAAFDAGQFDK